MKNVLLFILGFMLFGINSEMTGQEKIKWLTVAELEAAMASDPKPVFFDVYTDWCGWCKRMDMTTFRNKEVVEAINKNFHPVKFNAEEKTDVIFMGHTFKFIDRGRRGYNELAAALLDNKMSYPSFVALNEKYERITILKGYQQTDEFLIVLSFLSGEHYKNSTWKEYKSSITGD